MPRPVTLFVVALVTVAACRNGDSSVMANTPTSNMSTTPATVASSSTTLAIAPIGDRSESDRPDDAPGSPQLHLVHAVPLDGRDDRLDLDGTIAESVESAQAWLEAETGARLRFDTYDGRLDITFHRLPRLAADYDAEDVFIRDAIEADLRSAGFDRPDKIYVVYYGGPAVDCASAFSPETLPGNTVALYWTHVEPYEADCVIEPFAAAGDHAGLWELTLLHEVFHGLGAVATCAPNHFEGHVGDRNDDLLYRGDEPWYPSIVDVDRDDYWGHGRDDCPDLARSPYLVD